ncbi:hypothetical protein SLEP1_g46345 [Rubroshorea leprosula]|uniref:Uncharacterized protein n=1 Tax=Rubroshorea leprosula TaxID=152421 RepID=A0AAV5LMJ9_9ROSI|nr:hypothetical protein SLEP1_g46345 [Rubroshorea leprosula]
MHLEILKRRRKLKRAQTARRVPKCSKLSEEEGIMLQRNESQFIKHAIPYSQHHRSRSRNRHFHRPISLSRPAIHLFHTPINDSPILE